MSRALAWTRQHPVLLGLTSLFLLLLLSGLHHPDPHAGTFQLPGLLPSSYSPLTPFSQPGTPVFDHSWLTRSQQRRYAHLRSPRIPGSLRLQSGQGKYMFTTLTRNIADQLPDLLNTLYIVVNFLGPRNCYFSIMEGPSDDATPQVLEEVLKPMLLSIGVPESHIILKLRQRPIDFGKANRISALAVLRNEALAPLWHGWEDTTAVVYFNDVFLNPTDILELLHQHFRAGEAAGRETGITSGLDWWKKKPEYYYDVWVGRTIEGDLFYPMDSSWVPSDDLFPTSPRSKEEYANLNPFQVFSTWAGLAVLAATPFLEPHRLRFRRSDGSRDECAASECSLIANDFWKAGWGRVQVVPSVQVSYERNVAEDILEELSKQKKELGWEDGVPPDWRDPHVNWIAEPPEKVRCHPWPDAPGLSANVWENTRWVDPWI